MEHDTMSQSSNIETKYGAKQNLFFASYFQFGFRVYSFLQVTMGHN